MKRILAVNHFMYLERFEEPQNTLYYAPVINSAAQKAFFEKRFDSLKVRFPGIQWHPHNDEIEADVVLCWDAFDEKQRFGKKIYFGQNRLFDDLEFICPPSFSAFRRRAEKELPSRFENPIQPFDPEVLYELDYYFNQKRLAKTYFKTRNGMLGRNFSTKFSSFLSCGALDVRYLYNQVKEFEQEYGANKSTYWIVFELLWREFFYWHYQEVGTRFFSENGLDGYRNFSPIRRYSIQELHDRSHKVPFFQAALNELTETGFLSNRTRQMFASIWIHDLDLPWRSGADLFERYLIDYDVYSNWGNWMYLAGVGVDPRGSRYFNIDKQLSRYDPKNNYMRRWLAS
ncbi:MAG: FAD-binding domain-containing protein [Myxococcota bacterium]|nr:FAD-binding domain-containing protein [Myxococcota bacterium]